MGLQAPVDVTKWRHTDWRRLIADEDTNSARYIVLYDDTEERRYGSILMVF